MGEQVTQAEYARRLGVSREAVGKRTTPRGGPIPVHGPRKLIDVEQADALWHATIDLRQTNGATSRATIPDAAPAKGKPAKRLPKAQAAAQRAVDATLDEADPAMAAHAKNAGPAAQAKLASAIIRAQTDRINLERLKGTLVDKATAVRQAFTFARRFRDAWLNWPARVGPAMAAELGIEPHVLTAALERHVRANLESIGEQPFEPDPR